MAQNMAQIGKRKDGFVTCAGITSILICISCKLPNALRKSVLKPKHSST